MRLNRCAVGTRVARSTSVVGRLAGRLNPLGVDFGAGWPVQDLRGCSAGFVVEVTEHDHRPLGSGSEQAGGDVADGGGSGRAAEQGVGAVAGAFGLVVGVET
jgi:hypothetical protein